MHRVSTLTLTCLLAALGLARPARAQAPAPGQPPYGQPAPYYPQPPQPAPAWPSYGAAPGATFGDERLREQKKAAPGVTDAGLPFSRRGGLILDASSMKRASQEDPSITVLGLAARIPVARSTFVDARMPLGFGIAGNPTVGLHRVVRLGGRVWLTAGGAFGVPLAPSDLDAFSVLSTARAFWEVHDFYPDAVPLLGRLGLEVHSGDMAVRFDLDPTLFVPIENDAQLVTQQAVELQLGHAIGGGVRLQGVWLATFEGDNFQAALEPFFAVEHRQLFARTGLLLPLDQPLGPAFQERWGFRLATGLRFD